MMKSVWMSIFVVAQVSLFAAEKGTLFYPHALCDRLQKKYAMARFETQSSRVEGLKSISLDNRITGSKVQFQFKEEKDVPDAHDRWKAFEVEKIKIRSMGSHKEVAFRFLLLSDDCDLCIYSKDVENAEVDEKHVVTIMYFSMQNDKESHSIPLKTRNIILSKEEGFIKKIQVTNEELEECVCHILESVEK